MGATATRAYDGVSETLANARALPGAVYVDPDVFQAECARVLRTGWLPVARESDLANAGDYRAIDLVGTPLVVTRDAAGEIHVLSRICRHRGAPLVDGRGNAKALTCPYHLWRYALDGRFLSAPAMERSEIFARDACNLPSMPTARWGGWVFVNLDAAAAPLAVQIAPLTARLAAIDPPSMVTADVITLPSPWNWKLMIENFLESYHHIGPHAASLQQTNPGLGTYEGAGGALFTILENPPVDASQHPFVVAAIFPLTLMFFTEGPAPLGVWYELDDIRPDAFQLRIHLLTSPEFAASPAFVAAYRDEVLKVHREDIPACEGAQKGVTSPIYEPGPLSHLEASLWRFHLFLKRAMNQAR